MEKPRRSRGSSPRGVFEQSKSIALESIETHKAAERLKTERLKALRELRDQHTSDTDLK